MRLGRTLNLNHVQRGAFGPVRKKKDGTFAQTSGFKTPKGKLTQLSANQLAPNPVSPPYPDQTLERQELSSRFAAQEAILTRRSRFTLSSRTT